MASTNKTSKGLSQFLGTDRLQREDYNNDMKKLDDELNGLDQNKEPKFTKKGGFNKEKTDSVTTDSSVILATAKAVKTIWDALTSHRNSTTNPHTVTKNQVGLGNVPNYTITDSTTDGSSSKFGSAKAIKTVWTKALEILGLTNTNKNAILNNTEQIESLLKETSIEIQLNSGDGVARVSRKGNTVQISVDTRSSTFLNNVKVFELPSGFKVDSNGSLTTFLLVKANLGTVSGLRIFNNKDVFSTTAINSQSTGSTKLIAE